MSSLPTQSLPSALRRAGARARNLPALLERLPLFEQPLRFARHEVSPLRIALPHRLRRSGLTVVLRHHSTDVGALNEVFLRELYRPPGPVAARLQNLGRPPRVLDLGAHVGMFGLYVLGAHPNAEIVSVEPDPLNAVMLRRCIRANGRRDSWKVIDGAVSNHAGRSMFRFGEGAASRLLARPTANERSIEVELFDAFDLLEGVDLVKLDVEGGEWDILRDPRLADVPIPALVLEYHPAGCPGDDPRATAERLLTAAGLHVQHSTDQGDGMGMAWAWRE